MKWVLIGIGIVLALVVLVVLLGTVLPRAHKAASQITLHQSPDAVWTAVHDLANVPTWWKDLRTSKRVVDGNGHETWVQTMNNGTDLPLEIVESDPPDKLVTLIVSRPGAPFGGSWIYEITPVPGGTQIRVTEDGWVANPLFRVVSRATGYHSTLDGYLMALGKRFGETSQPVHISE
jgi:uncharacterized protein YndB with AHSA1/START domain